MFFIEKKKTKQTKKKFKKAKNILILLHGNKRWLDK